MPKTADEILADIAALDPNELKRIHRAVVTRNSRSGSYATRASQSLASMAGIRFPGILKTPNVCGGAARIIRTRIPVWTLEQMRQLGISESDILRSYPTLRAIDLVQAWGYAESHADEIAQLIRENEED